MSSLTELHEQARISYAYWPLWLMRRRQQVTARLAQGAPAAQEGEIVSLLRQAGLPLPDPLPALQPVQTQVADGIRLWFAVTAVDAVHSLGLYRQRTDGQVERCELLRVAQADDWYVSSAAAKFNALLEAHSVDSVFAAAHWWTGLHGNALPIIHWMPAIDPAIPSWE